MNTLTVGLIQEAWPGERDAAFANAVSGIREAVERGAGLVALQELHMGPYFCVTEDPDQFDLAEPIPGPSTAAFGKVAAELGVVLVLSLFERRAAGVYHNTAVVLEQDGTIAGRYRKMHIPDDPGYYEKFYFTPGDLGFTPITTSVGRLGVLVCWDQWYPEAARLMALAGAELLIYPTAIGWNPHDTQAEQQRQLHAWQTVQRAHAITNGLPVVAVNRVGAEGGNAFWGHSFVAGCQGELLAQADGEEAVVVATLDGAATESVRRLWPYLRDRRIDAYGGLTARFLDA